MGLQNVLAGYQCGTVYKPIYEEAQAAVALAMYLRAGHTPPPALVNGVTADTAVAQQREVCPPDAGVGHPGQHELHGHRRQLRDALAALHRKVRRGLHGGRHHPVVGARPAARSLPSAAMSMAAGPPPRSADAGRGGGPDGSAAAVGKPLLSVEQGRQALRRRGGPEWREPGDPCRAGDRPVGDNGAGKSTLIKTSRGSGNRTWARSTGTDEPVRIRGPKDATALGIATVYQDLALCDNLDIVQNMFLGREFVHRRFLDETTMEREAKQTLADLSVTTVRSIRQTVGSLSGGQRQAVAVARAVMQNARLVIMDEPTAALGVAQTAMVLGLDRHPPLPGHRGAGHLPQPQRRVRGRRPHRRPLPRPHGGGGPGIRLRHPVGGPGHHHR